MLLSELESVIELSCVRYDVLEVCSMNTACCSSISVSKPHWRLSFTHGVPPDEYSHTLKIRLSREVSLGDIT